MITGSSFEKPHQRKQLSSLGREWLLQPETTVAHAGLSLPSNEISGFAGHSAGAQCAHSFPPPSTHWQKTFEKKTSSRAAISRQRWVTHTGQLLLAHHHPLLPPEVRKNHDSLSINAAEASSTEFKQSKRIRIVQRLSACALRLNTALQSARRLGGYLLGAVSALNRHCCLAIMGNRS